MLTLVVVVATLLGVSASTSPPTLEGTAVTAPPPAQQSILPVHEVGLSVGLGVEIQQDRDAIGLFRLNVAWSPLDWLEISFLLPGASVLLGTRNGDEVVLSASVDGVGYGSVEGLIIVPSVGAAYRHWFSSATSLGVTARWTGQYSNAPAEQELAGSVVVTHTFGRVVSLNFAAGGAGWPSGASGLTFGSGRVGIRNLPLLRFQLSAVWCIDVDARLLVPLRTSRSVTQQYVLGFSGIW